MLKLVTERPLTFRALRQVGVNRRAPNRCGQQVSVVLQKIDIILPKAAEVPRINLQDTERPMLTANDDVNGALDPMLFQQHRNLKSGLRRDVFGDDRLSGSQGISGRRAIES